MGQKEDINQSEPCGAETPVCPCCLEPCSPLDFYCPHCASNEAINPLASYMPFVRIRFEVGMYGKLWNKCWYEKDVSFYKRFFFFLVFLFYAPSLLAGLPFVLVEKFSDKRSKKTRLFLAYCIFWLVLAGFLGLFVWRSFA